MGRFSQFRPQSEIILQMDRRSFLYLGAATVLASRASWGADGSPNSRMGIAMTSFMTGLQPRDAYQSLELCHSFGAAGVQLFALNGDLPKLKARAEELGMFLEVMVPLPKDGQQDIAAFEKTLQDAKAVSAACLRAASLPTRRYETFATLNEYAEWVKRSDAALDAVVPLLDKYKIRLGLENHKDRTVDELVAVLKRYSSQYLGSCLDFGNNIALLDDPMDAIQKLAPYVVTTHLKDVGVEPYGDGFLLSELPLGDGFLDLSSIVSLIRAANPIAHFMLEMITRDPLKVPCLTDKYWATFPERNGLYLARTLKLVAEKTDRSKPLPRISQLPKEEQVRMAQDNVKACMAYAKKLNLA
jgi:sugar phosphate isomerase/epimerase